MSSAYLRLLIFLPTVLIPAYASSGPAFHMMYSTYKLKSKVTINSLDVLLTCIQITQEAVKVVWYSHLFKNFLQFVVIHIVKGFSIVSEEEVYVLLEVSCSFYDPTDVGNLISGYSAFSKSSLNIWKFSVHILLKPSLENFEHYFASAWNECNCVVVWAFFGIDLSFPNLLAYWV